MVFLCECAARGSLMAPVLGLFHSTNDPCPAPYIKAIRFDAAFGLISQELTVVIAKCANRTPFSTTWEPSRDHVRHNGTPAPTDRH